MTGQDTETLKKKKPKPKIMRQNKSVQNIMIQKKGKFGMCEIMDTEKRHSGLAGYGGETKKKK